MKIIIIDSNFEKKMEVGDSKDFPIPRIGEHVEYKYNPPPIVKNIVYRFAKNEILIWLNK